MKPLKTMQLPRSRVAIVPQGQAEAEPKLVIGTAADRGLTPAIGLTARMVARE